MNHIVSTWLLLVVLAAAWAVVLVPDFMRRSSMTRRNDTMSQFSRNMSSLGRPQARGFSYTPRQNLSAPGFSSPAQAPRPAQRVSPPVGAVQATRVAPAGAPQRRSAQAQRRQEVLLALVAAAVLTFLGAVSVGGIFVAIHVVADLAFVAYLGALASVSRREAVRPNVTALRPRQELHHVVPAYASSQQRRVAR